LHGPSLLTVERVEATVAFLDIKDFTEVTRHEQPEPALRRLNANFEVLIPELVARGGLVDKFLGDAVMAVFRGPEHTTRALEACLAARQQLRTMAFRHGEQSPYTHGVCIGLDSGELLSGNVGARGMGRMNYTLLGDAVNTAARLASMAGRDQALITGALHQRVEKSFECVPLGMRVLPGTSTPVALHEVVSRRSEEVSAQDDTASLPAAAPSGTPPALGLAAQARKD
jgi:class 3 adenylate cyclase